MLEPSILIVWSGTAACAVLNPPNAQRAIEIAKVAEGRQLLLLFILFFTFQWLFSFRAILLRRVPRQPRGYVR